ncbi:MAG: phosphate signaling complex protein PhoU [Actinomycetota bacterium]|nr:phosphate signaling complex protein PhoU [Actinomycetota bacterium]
MTSNFGELRRSFHDDLAELRSRVEEMAAVVVEGIRLVTDALLDGDAAAATAVVEADARIDAVYPTVETDVFHLVATQSPVARDLRFLMATLRVAMEVERSGDLVASVGRRVADLDPVALTPAVRRLLSEMGVRATAMFTTAAAAYATLDADRARALPAEDDAMDELHRRLLHELFASDGAAVASVVELGLIARFYERVADHAVVIAERVGFVVDGSMNASDSDEQGW